MLSWFLQSLIRGISIQPKILGILVGSFMKMKWSIPTGKDQSIDCLKWTVQTLLFHFVGQLKIKGN